MAMTTLYARQEKKKVEKITNLYIVPLNTILDISQFMKVKLKVKSLSCVQP